MKAVIMAGGKGTRVSEVSGGKPKCLIKINGITVLEHQLSALKKEEINEVTICLGYESEKVVSFLDENNFFGMDIEYFVEKEPRGTAGSLNQLGDLGEDFILLLGDIVFDIYFEKFIKFHKENNGIATLFVHPNDHPYDSDLVVSKGNKIESFIMKNQPKSLINNSVCAGLFIMNKSILQYTPKESADVVNDIFPKVLKSDCALYAYNSSEYVKDMGSPERIKEVENSIKAGLLSKRNLRNKQRAVFIDRDGVINEEVDHLLKIKDFKLISKSVDAVRNLNNSDFLVIVVTNQPAVAKGFCEISDIERIHMHMETLFGKHGAKFDSIHYCPCHPEKGFPGENVKYKRDCEFRKPKIGMLEEASNFFNIDYSKSFIVGDTTRDILTGINAGVRTILVKTGYGGNDDNYDVNPDFVEDNLFTAVNNIILKA